MVNNNEDIRFKVAEEIVRQLIGLSGDNFDPNDMNSTVNKQLKHEGVNIVVRGGDLDHGSNDDDPFDQPVSTWGDMDGHDTSIELTIETMKEGEEYPLDYNGVKHYVTYKQVGEDSFEIHIRPVFDSPDEDNDD